MNICIQCGNEFKPSKNTTGNFCSQECEVKHRFAKKHIQYELGKLTNIKTIKIILYLVMNTNVQFAD